MTRRHGAVRALLALLAATLLALAGGVAPRPAAAASSDVVKEWKATYTVEPSGDTRVVEELTYVFPRSDAQGIIRRLVTKEPWQGGKENDRTYAVSVVSVTATQGASASYTRSEVRGTNDTQVELKIGTAGRYLPANTPITYTITYLVSDALIDAGHGPELYWDVVPMDTSQTVEKASVTVQMPSSELVRTSCNAGRAGATGGCASADQQGGTATFTAGPLGQGRGGMTVGVIAPAGSVQRTGPTLVPSETKANAQRFAVGAGAFGAGTVASILGGLLWWRRNGRDERYQGLAPGIVPAPNEQVGVGIDGKPEIPVQFTPPRISVGEAGLLADGVVDVRDTTATLVDLAVKGVIGISSDPATKRTIIMARQHDVALLPHERELLESFFINPVPGYEIDISARGTMVDAHERVTRSLLARVREAGYYRQVPGALGGLQGIRGCAPFILMALFLVPGTVLSVLAAAPWAAALVPIAVGFAVVGFKRARGRRSALGRALTDQIEGFRTYLATAEADQIRFEEGEDIFSRYLPWAIMFKLTDRWTKICQQLVAMGRIPDYQPSWYYGPWYGFGSFDTGYLDDSLSTSATPVQSDSGSGSGGSSFDSGGFSGGGGGGGGSDTW